MLCLRECWWKCEDEAWGRVGGIMKTMFGGELVEF